MAGLGRNLDPRLLPSPVPFPCLLLSGPEWRSCTLRSLPPGRALSCLGIASWATVRWKPCLYRCCADTEFVAITRYILLDKKPEGHEWESLLVAPLLPVGLLKRQADESVLAPPAPPLLSLLNCYSDYHLPRPPCQLLLTSAPRDLPARFGGFSIHIFLGL